MAWGTTAYHAVFAIDKVRHFGYFDSYNTQGVLEGKRINAFSLASVGVTGSMYIVYARKHRKEMRGCFLDQNPGNDGTSFEKSVLIAKPGSIALWNGCIQGCTASMAEE
jgi:hypothetical protein